MTSITDSHEALAVFTSSAKKRGMLQESLTKFHHDYVTKFVSPANRLDSSSLTKVINLAKSVEVKNMRNVLSKTLNSSHSGKTRFIPIVECLPKDHNSRVQDYMERMKELTL
jgi:hypothetical protein